VGKVPETASGPIRLDGHVLKSQTFAPGGDGMTGLMMSSLFQTPALPLIGFR
jgi:hypothetical protein